MIISICGPNWPQRMNQKHLPVLQSYLMILGSFFFFTSRLCEAQNSLQGTAQLALKAEKLFKFYAFPQAFESLHG